MKVLLISNQRLNAFGVGNPIMYRMLKALKNDNRIDEAEFFPFSNNLLSFYEIRNKVKNYDLVHVHFGGLYALLIRLTLFGTKSRKYITFHGTDIHAKAIKSTTDFKRKIKIKLNQWASFICLILFEKCGFVAEEMINYIPFILKNTFTDKFFIHPLGVDYELFKPMSKHEAAKKLGIESGKYVLFSDVSNTDIKRRDIAENIVKELGGDYRLLIMSGVKPNMVPYYINVCDFLLLTSDEEGSPNIIRECLALDKPIFSVDVGDVAKQLKGLTNSCIISREPKKAAQVIRTHLEIPYVDNTRVLCSFLDFQKITSKVVDLY